MSGKFIFTYRSILNIATETIINYCTNKLISFRIDASVASLTTGILRSIIYINIDDDSYKTITVTKSVFGSLALSTSAPEVLSPSVVRSFRGFMFVSALVRRDQGGEAGDRIEVEVEATRVIYITES